MKKLAPTLAALVLIAALAGCSSGGEASPTPTSVSSASPTSEASPLVSPSPVVGSHATSLASLVAAIEQTNLKCPSGWNDGGGSMACATPSMQVFYDPLAPGDTSLMTSTISLYHQVYDGAKGGVVAGDNWVFGADSDLALALVTLNVGGEVV